MNYTPEQITEAYERHVVQFGINAVKKHSFLRRLEIGWDLQESQNTKKLSSKEISVRAAEQSKLNRIARKAKAEKDYADAYARMEQESREHIEYMIKLEEQYKKEIADEELRIKVFVLIVLMAILLFIVYSNLGAY